MRGARIGMAALFSSSSTIQLTIARLDTAPSVPGSLDTGTLGFCASTFTPDAAKLILFDSATVGAPGLIFMELAGIEK